MKKTVFVFAFLTLFFFSACSSSVLYENLTQRDQQRILVLLQKNGINATSERVEQRQEISWTIMVEEKDLSKARALLVSYHLPRDESMGLIEEICGKSDLLSSPRIEKCQMILVTRRSLIDMIQKIHGVLMADVIISIPDEPEFPDPDAIAKRPKASVVIEASLKDVKASGETSLDEGKIQQLVASAVDGMDIPDVTVVISYRDEPQVVANNEVNSKEIGPSDTKAPNSASMVTISGIEISESTEGRFKIFMGVLLGLFVIMGMALLFVLFKFFRIKQQLVGPNQEVADSNNSSKALPKSATNPSKG